MDTKFTNPEAIKTLKEETIKMNEFFAEMDAKIAAAQKVVTDAEKASKQPLTARLNHWGNNTLVIAKMYNGKPEAITYSNRTQAQKKLDSLKDTGLKLYIYQGHNFYVAVDESK